MSVFMTLEVVSQSDVSLICSEMFRLHSRQTRSLVARNDFLRACCRAAVDYSAFARLRSLVIYMA